MALAPGYGGQFANGRFKGFGTSTPDGNKDVGRWKDGR